MDEDEIDIKETFTEVVKEETNKIYEQISEINLFMKEIMNAIKKNDVQVNKN